MTSSARPFRAVATPITVGYSLAVAGVGTFEIEDGYTGTLEDQARRVVAQALHLPEDAVVVRVEHAMMTRFVRPSTFSWKILVGGLLVVAAAVAGVLSHTPALVVMAAFGLLGLAVARLVTENRAKAAADERHD